MLEVGAITEGKVVRIMPFGVFVETEEKQSGLVHISEISNSYVKEITDILKIGDQVKVKVIEIDGKGRMNFSIKQATETALKKEKKQDSAPNKPVRPADADFFARSDEGLSFEEKLLRFKQDSDEKMQALKRSAESKRSGGYSRKGSR